MKSILVLCLAVFCAVSFGQNDEKCKNDFTEFLKCAKSSTSDADRQAKKKELQDKASQCFQQAGCDAPDWDADPTNGAMKQKGGQMPDSVKQCLKKKMSAKIGTKLNECLAKRGVKSVDWAAIADGAEGAGMTFGEGGKEGMHGAMSAQFNAVKAVDKCCQSKKGGDTDAMKPLEKCLHDVKKSAKPQMCAALKPCEDKVSPPCKSRGQEIKKALCLCKKEKEIEIAGKLKTLGQEKKVSIQDLLKTVADDQDMQDIMDDVDKCYKDQNVEEPPMMKLAMQFMRNGGGGRGGGGRFGAAMSVNGSTCIIMSDMLTLDGNDKSDCDACPN